MATDVVMPQMGESIAEGTIVRWIKKVGDKVDRDEPLFEISTDKVDAEIPSPAAGVVSEIRVKEGETVPVNSVVAVIGSASAAASAPAASADKGAGSAKAPEPQKAAPPPPPRHYHDVGEDEETAAPPAAAPPSAAPSAGAASEGKPKHDTPATSNGTAARHAAVSTEDAIRERSSPLVRKIAKE